MSNLLYYTSQINPISPQKISQTAPLISDRKNN